MSVNIKRGYVLETDIDNYSDISSDNKTTAKTKIAMAEEQIDAIVGWQNRHVKSTYEGTATTGSTTYLIDTSSNSPLTFNDNYFNYCVVEILDGTNSGNINRITDYDKDTQKITVADAFGSAIDSTSVYKIYQLNKFPRVKDVITQDSIYYKSIPSVVKQAVLAQIQFIVDMGDEFFTNTANFKSESMERYSYEIGNGAHGINRLIAPKVKLLLKRIINKKGKLIT